MTRRMLTLALAISVLFNLAVLIGFVRARTQAPTAPDPTMSSASAPDGEASFQMMSKDLQLDERQAKAVGDLRARMRLQNVVFNDSLAVARQDLMEELRKDEPDLERIRALVDQEADLLRQRRLAQTDLYGEFLEMLSPDQRRALGAKVEKIAPHRQRHAPPRAIMQRFDRNGNGRLEPDEARAAHREMERRRREVVARRPQPPPLGRWFDADDDGELNDAERAAMEQFMREHRPAARPGTRPPSTN